MRNADKMLLTTKSDIDLRLAQDEKLQMFLKWVSQKSSSVQVNYKPSAVRAFYFTLDRNLVLALDHSFDHDHNHDLRLDRDLALISARNLISTRRLINALDLISALTRDLDRSLTRTHQKFDLRDQLQDVRDRISDTSYKNLQNFKQWWETNGQKWREDLRQITIAHRNIGHDWQFTDAQKALLQQYYDANLLLIECLNSDCYVSRSVREEIEATLLLPMEEIEKLRMQN
jgi:predicted NACHT family NTPase